MIGLWLTQKCRITVGLIWIDCRKRPIVILYGIIQKVTESNRISNCYYRLTPHGGLSTLVPDLESIMIASSRRSLQLSVMGLGFYEIIL
jgi:hypothetical protein